MAWCERHPSRLPIRGRIDPFPREDVARLVRRVPAYARLAWRLSRDPFLSRSRRTAVLGAAGYLISPIDLIPGMIPVLGQLDDLLILVLALRFALAGLSPEQRAAHLAAVGLQDDHLSEDLRALELTAAWLVRAGGRTAFRVGRDVALLGASVARRVAPVAWRGAQDAGAAAVEFGSVGPGSVQAESYRVRGQGAVVGSDPPSQSDRAARASRQSPTAGSHHRSTTSSSPYHGRLTVPWTTSRNVGRRGAG